MAEHVRARVQAVSEEIRELKASLKESGLNSAAINANATVQARVAELRDLKAQLPDGDDLTDQAFFQKQKKEQEERERLRRQQADAERRSLQSTENLVEIPLVQRKIFHLFAFSGTGDAFHYEPPPRLNAEQTGFGGGERPSPSVYVTEKWDGTTMQATRQAIFRRQDVMGKKRAKDPSQRYELKLVAWRDHGSSSWRGLDFIDADRRMHEALTPHLDRFAALEAGLCVYFECVHSHINTTYSHIEGFADIRVFDFSRVGPQGTWQEGAFLPFDESIELAKRYQFPLVGWERREQLSASEIWAELQSAAVNGRYATVEAPLEGFVVREVCGDRIAKARVEHIKKIAVDRAPGHDRQTKAQCDVADPVGFSAAVGGPGSSRAALAANDQVATLSLDHLKALGLLPPGGQGSSSGQPTCNCFVLSAPWEKL